MGHFFRFYRAMRIIDFFSPTIFFKCENVSLKKCYVSILQKVMKIQLEKIIK